jgi:hypothetical protein
MTIDGGDDAWQRPDLSWCPPRPSMPNPDDRLEGEANHQRATLQRREYDSVRRATVACASSESYPPWMTWSGP